MIRQSHANRMRICRIEIDGERVSVPHGASVAAAVLMTGRTHFRTSVTGQPRAPLCGMGICFECRVTIDGIPHQRSCLIPVRDDMIVRTA